MPATVPVAGQLREVPLAQWAYCNGLSYNAAYAQVLRREVEAVRRGFRWLVVERPE